MGLCMFVLILTSAYIQVLQAQTTASSQTSDLVLLGFVSSSHCRREHLVVDQDFTILAFKLSADSVRRVSPDQDGPQFFFTGEAGTGPVPACSPYNLSDPNGCVDQTGQPNACSCISGTINNSTHNFFFLTLNKTANMATSDQLAWLQWPAHNPPIITEKYRLPE
ncbi:hypothetical protein EGW08_022773, partial [Elysia chlorotica]